ncbi:SRPBCC family protein [Streptomyces griseoviridis]|uniref:Uncharacterized protein n=1 Tax=Streptomyces griseoviridis TaxID=45398 RepID=A0A918GII9_STRGD|nr:SRPBCC family protein [Streptomyces niveoruber]GGS40116.1 hypothetical protein GCM10010238_32050 [Streptomyces niveoruber]
MEAAPERVREPVAGIGLPARPGPELRRVAWLDGADGPSVGARFEGHHRHAVLGEWRTVCQVTEPAAPRALTWAVTDADGRYGPPVRDPERAMAVRSLTLQAAEAGTRLRQSVRPGPGPSGLTAAMAGRTEREPDIIAYRPGELRKGMRETLSGVRSPAERTR